MCRWIAYQGAEIPLERYLTRPANSLISQSLNARESTFPTNGDGFGMGWYGAESEPGLYHEVRPAWSDENLQHLARHINSRLFFGHVRAATGTAVNRSNCHPFATGAHLFMHNGFVEGWEQMRREIESLIPDALYPQRKGSTDSEALFLGLMGQDADDMVRGTARYLEKLTPILQRGTNGRGKFRFTMALSDGQRLFAVRHAQNDHANTLYAKPAPAALVIASEPLDEQRATWEAVPDGHALLAVPGAKPQVFAFP